MLVTTCIVCNQQQYKEKLYRSKHSTHNEEILCSKKMKDPMFGFENVIDIPHTDSRREN